MQPLFGVRLVAGAPVCKSPWFTGYPCPVTIDFDSADRWSGEIHVKLPARWTGCQTFPYEISFNLRRQGREVRTGGARERIGLIPVHECPCRI